MIFTEEQFTFFRLLANQTQKDLLRLLIKYLNKLYGKDKVISTKKYVCAIGSIPICLVAHLDTVHSSPPKEMYFDKEQDVIWSPQGLGADDRAGVFAILDIIDRGLRPHLIFTTDEEKGGLGAYCLCVEKHNCPFKDIRYFIELDRCNINDCVFYDCYNESFMEYIESFGFHTEIGSFSDISFLCEQWEIAGVNLSVGYFNEHTKIEYLKSSGLLGTIDKVISMLSEQTKDIPIFKYIEGSLVDKNTTVCSECNTFISNIESIPVWSISNKGIPIAKPMCALCLEKLATWCPLCGRPHKTKYCPICGKKVKVKYESRQT